MLVYTWIFLCITCATTAAEERLPISELHHTNKKNLNIETVTLKERKKLNKLTFQTLYPQFMSTWSSLKLNEKHRQVSQVIRKREERRQFLTTKKVNRYNKPTTLKRNSIYNAFIEVETMRPYLPKRNSTSRKTPVRKITRLSQDKQMRNLSAPASTSHKFSDYLKDQIKRRRILLPVSTSYPVQKLNSLKPNIFQSSNNTSIPLTNDKQVSTRLHQLDNDLKTIRNVVSNDAEVTNHLKSEVRTLSIKNAKSQAEIMKRIDSIKVGINNNYFSKNRRNINERLNRSINKAKKANRNENDHDINKVKQLRMEWLKQKLAGGPNQDVSHRRNNNKFDDVKDKDEGKEDNYSMDEFNWTRDKTPNIIMNKIQTGMDKKRIGNNNINVDFINIDQITKDPLAYDSFDLKLEHESNIQEISRLKSKNTLPAFKRHANKRYSTDKEEAEPNFPSLHNDDGRRDSFLFAPPPGFNKTNLELTKHKNNDQEVLDDVLEKILNVPADPLKRDYVIDNTKALGKKMLERLDLPGLKIDDTVMNKDFDHVKYVDSVMRQSSLPLSERRNIIKESLDKRLNELYEKYNLKPKQTTKDDLDNVLKSMGATLHK